MRRGRACRPAGGVVERRGAFEAEGHAIAARAQPHLGAQLGLATQPVEPRVVGLVDAERQRQPARGAQRGRHRQRVVAVEALAAASVEALPAKAERSPPGEAERRGEVEAGRGVDEAAVADARDGDAEGDGAEASGATPRRDRRRGLRRPGAARSRSPSPSRRGSRAQRRDRRWPPRRRTRARRPTAGARWRGCARARRRWPRTRTARRAAQRPRPRSTAPTADWALAS
jgi:hypothetical protein